MFFCNKWAKLLSFAWSSLSKKTVKDAISVQTGCPVRHQQFRPNREQILTSLNRPCTIGPNHTHRFLRVSDQTLSWWIILLRCLISVCIYWRILLLSRLITRGYTKCIHSAVHAVLSVILPHKQWMDITSCGKLVLDSFLAQITRPFSTRHIVIIFLPFSLKHSMSHCCLRESWEAFNLVW